MNEQSRHNLFSELVSRHQHELYSYIFSVVRNWPDADDLFQSVCLVLWGKFDAFREDSSFLAWARQTARFTIAEFLRRRQKNRYASEELIVALADTAAALSMRHDERDFYLATLRGCMEKLDPPDEELLELRYVDGLGSRQIADRMNRPQRSVSNSFARIHRRLFDCIQLESVQAKHLPNSPQ